MADLTTQKIDWADLPGGDCGIKEYDRNPFIRCLPPPPSAVDCFRHLLSTPECTDLERSLPPHLREQLVFIRIKQSFIPTGAQVRQAMKIDLLLRAGYVPRDPSLGLYQGLMTALAKARPGEEPSIALDGLKCVGMVAESMSILGVSGGGKTTTGKRMLAGYRQVVKHNDSVVGTLTQIVWLRIEAASDGSTKGTVMSMFAEIDKLIGTDYAGKYARLTRENLLVKAGLACAKHAIGLIVVDEIQNLTNSKAGETDLMSFLTSLVNVVGVPLLMIGTMKAFTMMTQHIPDGTPGGWGRRFNRV